MNTLEDVYERLKENPDDKLANIKLYHSSIHYVRAHINSKFNKNYSLEQIARMLEEEEIPYRLEEEVCEKELEELDKAIHNVG